MILLLTKPVNYICLYEFLVDEDYPGRRGSKGSEITEGREGGGHIAIERAASQNRTNVYTREARFLDIEFT